MKRTATARLSSALLGPVLLLSACTGTGERAAPPLSVGAQEQFQRIVALEGSWFAADGSTDDPDLVYELTSGGSAVLETVFPGQSHEMRTLYFIESGALTLVHYCALGNRPRMVADDWDADSLHFTLDGDGGLGSVNEMHMHSALFEFKGPDAFRTTWALFDKGTMTENHGRDLVRRAAN